MIVVTKEGKLEQNLIPLEKLIELSERYGDLNNPIFQGYAIYPVTQERIEGFEGQDLHDHIEELIKQNRAVKFETKIVEDENGDKRFCLVCKDIIFRISDKIIANVY